MNEQEKEVLSKEAFEQYCEQHEEAIASIKRRAIAVIDSRDKRIAELEKSERQAIDAIERRDENIANLEKNLNREQSIVNQGIEEIKSKIQKIALIEEGLRELKETIENKNNDELNRCKDEKQKIEKDLIKEQELSSRLEKELEDEKGRYEEYKNKWEQEKELLIERIDEYKQKVDIKERFEADLKNLKEEIHYELYEQYCALPNSFRERCGSIDSSNLYNFIKTSTQDTAIFSLYGFIRDDTKERRSGIDTVMIFFNALFEVISKEKPNLKRLDVSRGDDFRDREMIKIGDGPSQGRVKEVIFQGCVKDREVLFKSLVEIE